MKPSEYDRNIKKWIPKYEEMQEVIVEMLPFKKNQYDVVVSLLSIHHLTDSQKKRLFKKVYFALRPKGVFVNGDFVISKSNTVNIKSAETEKKFMLSQGVKEEGLLTLRGGVCAEDDIPAAMENQLKWLKDVGFDETECLWRYFNYAICFGSKREQG